jgi:PTH2 family peptidyl-tRNA hydrolase
MTTPSKIKMVAVIRNDLNMRKGKMVVQGGHGFVQSVLEQYDRSARGVIDEWHVEGQRKICVRAKSEEELQQLYAASIAANIHAVQIIDAGHTEFNGVPTMTCIVVGPATDEQLDPITGKLELL